MYLSDNYTESKTIPHPKLNTRIHVGYIILKHVVPPANEAETCGICYNYKVIIAIIYMLLTLEHLKAIIPLRKDNEAVAAFNNFTFKENTANHGMCNYTG